jgi:spore maturation protein CgeB
LPAIEGVVDRRVVDQTRRLFDEPDHRAEVVEHNYRIAARFFSYRVLRDSLRTLINNVRNLTE